MADTSYYSVGIDIGGTKISNATVNLNALAPDELVGNFQEVPTPQDTEGFLDALLTMIKAQKTYQPKAASVGISTAGIVDSIQGRILGSTGNLPAVQGCLNLKEILESRISLPVHIENDANAAAYGECRAGAARGKENIVMVTLGTGVGTGLVVHNRMVRGSHFSAGEGGHIPISYHHERQCTCGRWDCWEAFASGTGVRATARKMLQEATEAERQAFLSVTSSAVEEVTSHQVIAALKAGDSLAKKMIDLWHLHISLGLRAIYNLLDPDTIVIGGGMAKFVDMDQLRSITQPQAMMPNIQMALATLGNQAGIVGASFLAGEYAETLSASMRA